jgi:hypothetical protein
VTSPTAEPLTLPDPVMDLAERVAELCDGHRAHYEARFAEKLLDVLRGLHERTESGEARELCASVMRVVKAMGGLDS